MIGLLLLLALATARFDQSSIEYSRRMRFRPAIRDERLVRSVAYQPIVFDGAAR